MQTGTAVKSSHVGTAQVSLLDSTGLPITVKFKNALYVPSLQRNLVSLGQLAKATTNASQCELDLVNKRLRVTQGISLKIYEEKSLYFFSQRMKQCSATVAIPELQLDKPEIIPVYPETNKEHLRVGHPGKAKTHLIKNYYGINIKYCKCESCQLNKSRRSSFNPGPLERRVKEALDEVCFDTAVVHTVSFNGNSYLLGFVDVRTRFMFVFPMIQKSDAYEGIKRFETQVGIPMCYRFDGEFESTDFKQSCLDRRIKMKQTCAYSSQQNPFIESQWKVIFTIARTNLWTSGLPKCYWDYAVTYAVYQRNLWPLVYHTQDLSGEYISTPHKELHGYDGRIEMLRVFGCTAYLHKFKHQRDDTKLSTRAKKGVFLGVDSVKKGYIILVTDEMKFYTSKDVTFQEDDFSVAKEINEVDTVEENPNDRSYEPDEPQFTQEDEENDSEDSSDEAEEAQLEQPEDRPSTREASQPSYIHYNTSEGNEDTTEETSTPSHEIEDTMQPTEISESASDSVSYSPRSGYFSGGEPMEVPEDEESYNRKAPDLECRRSERIKDKEYRCLAAAQSLPIEPIHVHQALRTKEADLWMEAMKDEISRTGTKQYLESTRQAQEQKYYRNEMGFQNQNHWNRRN